jgi:hypothetical protein
MKLCTVFSVSLLSLIGLLSQSLYAKDSYHIGLQVGSGKPLFDDSSLGYREDTSDPSGEKQPQ